MCVIPSPKKTGETKLQAVGYTAKNAYVAKSVDSQDRRENSRGPRQNFIRSPHDVIIFKQQD